MTFTSAFTTQSHFTSVPSATICFKSWHMLVTGRKLPSLVVDVDVLVVSDTTVCLLVVSVKSTREYLNVVLVDNLVEVTQVLVDVVVVLQVEVLLDDLVEMDARVGGPSKHSNTEVSQGLSPEYLSCASSTAQ